MSEISRDLGTWRFWRRFLTHSFAAVGAIAVVLGIVNSLFPHGLKIQGLQWGLAILTLSVLYGLVQSWPRPIEQAYSSPNTVIRVLKGDILEEECHLVIGACDTFDTQPPNIIAKDSLQGQLLDRLFGGDVGELDRRVTEALAGYTNVGLSTSLGRDCVMSLGRSRY